MPILIDEYKQIIDGDHRKRIADEFDYDCPEVVHEGLTEDEKRTLARALNLARRQLNREQKRKIIADQLVETPKRSSRWVAKMLGVSHPTVSSVRRELESSGNSTAPGWKVLTDEPSLLGKPQTLRFGRLLNVRQDSRRPHSFMETAGES